MAEYISPGVYIEERASGAQPIKGAATSTTAFIGRTRRGPVDTPVAVHSFAEFERRFGSLAPSCPMPYAVQQFFDNGGMQAVIVRVRNGSRSLTDEQISGAALQVVSRGIWALDKIDAFNLLCIPPLSFTRDVGKPTWDAAAQYCQARGAFLVIDPPSSWSSSAAALASEALEAVVTRTTYAALYFPRIMAVDALGGATRTFAPCGAVTGIMARTDAHSGVWKSPAGTDAVLTGVTGLSVAVNASEADALNALGINSLRLFAGRGYLVFGARTLAAVSGSDAEFRYIALRRFSMHVEQSLTRGLQGAAFEPNGELLWGNLTSTATDFLTTLWRNGALLGAKPSEAFFVRCGIDTMTQVEIDQGVIHLLIGLALIRPAEFSIFRATLNIA